MWLLRWKECRSQQMKGRKLRLHSVTRQRLLDRRTDGDSSETAYITLCTCASKLALLSLLHEVQVVIDHRALCVSIIRVRLGMHRFESLEFENRTPFLDTHGQRKIDRGIYKELNRRNIQWDRDLNTRKRVSNTETDSSNHRLDTPHY